MIKTPWPQDLVDRLNAQQQAGIFHPYTCGSGRRTDKDHKDGEGVLVATPQGWMCPFCDYRQDWAGDMPPIVVQSVKKITEACPTQWRGIIDPLRGIYARYRYGSLSIDIVRGEDSDREQYELIFDKFLGQDQNDEEVIARYKQDAWMGPEMIEKMVESFKNMRAAFHGEPICFDGTLSYDQLKEATKGVFEWPDQETT